MRAAWSAIRTNNIERADCEEFRIMEANAALENECFEQAKIELQLDPRGELRSLRRLIARAQEIKANRRRK